jgi:hypothetical protein
LHKWKLNHTDKCGICQNVETVKHAIYDCTIAKDAIAKSETFFKNIFKLNTDFALTYENVLLGTLSSNVNVQLHNATKVIIDKLLVLLKQKLILQRNNKELLSYSELANLFQSRLRLEKCIRGGEYVRRVSQL